jgi:predicted ATP-grasp superfamily ATP-dependent carboligase
MGEGLTLHVRPVLRDAPLVLAFEGWNDAGEAASAAVNYLDRAVRAVPLAEIPGDEFLDYTVHRPTVRISDDDRRVIEWPATVFRYGSADADREIILGLGVEPHLNWRRFAGLVSQFATIMGVRRVLLLGAYVADVVYSRPVGLTGHSSRPEGLAPVGAVQSRYEGPTGIVGVLGERLLRDGFEVASIWAGLPHYINASPNSRGALALVQALKVHLGIALDDAPLRRQAAEFEQRISTLVTEDPDLSEYVRQLKRREFAQ